MHITKMNHDVTILLLGWGEIPKIDKTLQSLVQNGFINQSITLHLVVNDKSIEGISGNVLN